MRIAFLIRSLGIGGAERQLTNLAIDLKSRGVDVAVGVFYGGGIREAALRSHGVHVEDLGKRGRWDAASFFVRTVRWLRAFEPSIVHGYMEGANLAATMMKPFLRSGARLVWGVRASNMDMEHYGWWPRVVSRLTPLAAGAADCIIVNSEHGRRHHLARGYPGERTFVIPNGIDTRHFYPDDDERRACRRAWGVGDDEPLVGLVGRLEPIKGHREFLNAAGIVVRKHRNARFVCLGDGSDAQAAELRKLARDLELSGRVIWRAGTDSMREAYNAMDILVSASSGESFSNVIAEAMACGIPCVVTDVGDSAAIVGDCGIVVPPKDAPALADGIAGMLERIDGRRDSLREESVKRIRERFSTERLGVDTLHLLESVAQDRPLATPS